MKDTRYRETAARIHEMLRAQGHYPSESGEHLIEVDDDDFIKVYYTGLEHIDGVYTGLDIFEENGSWYLRIPKKRPVKFDLSPKGIEKALTYIKKVIEEKTNERTQLRSRHSERERLLRQGEVSFSKIVEDLNKLFPQGRPEAAWEQICVALALLERVNKSC